MQLRVYADTIPNMQAIISLTLKDEKATENLARAMASASFPGLVVFLKGELGSGKTTFVRGFLRGLNFSGSVKSPTYTLVEEYDFAWGALYHFDLYRLAHPGELEFIGIREYFAESAMVLVEWPERGKGVLKEPDLELCFNFIEGNFTESDNVDNAKHSSNANYSSTEDKGRRVSIAAISDIGKTFLEKIKKWKELGELEN